MDDCLDRGVITFRLPKPTAAVGILALPGLVTEKISTVRDDEFQELHVLRFLLDDIVRPR